MTLELDRERYARARELFHAAAEREDASRDQFLTEACGSDAELRRTIDALFAASQQRDPLPEAALLRERLLGGSRSGPASTPEEIPERIGPYTILGRIGSGGMAEVFEARQEQPDRRVALKLIHSAWVSPRRARRFEDEIEILGRLRHENVARIYDSGEVEHPTGRIRYFVMERVEGRPLGEWAADGTPNVEARLRVIVGACRGVSEAHRHGIIHRDLKPGNILVEGDGTAKVVDFGIARARTDELTEVTGAETRTRAGELLGTLQYMSPEQLAGDPEALDTRTDVYSMGVVLFELLSGTLPHDIASTSLPHAIGRLAESIPRRLSRVAPDLPADLESIVAKALESELEHRYASIDQLSEDLTAYLERRPIRARPPSTWRRLRLFAVRQRRVFVALAALALTVVASLFLVLRFALHADRARAEAVDARRASQLEAYRAHVATAAAALEAGDASTARASLEAADPALRGWEWKRLLARVDESLAVFRGHRSPVWDVAVSRNGTRLFTVGGAMVTPPFEQAVRAFDSATGAILWAHTDLPDQQLSVALIDDDRTVLTGGGDDDPNLRLWRAKDGELLQTLPAHLARVECILLFDEGSRVLTAGGGGRVELWRVEAGRLRHERRVAEGLGRILDAALADGVLYLSIDGTRVIAMALDTGEQLWTHRAKVTDVAVDGRGQRLACGYSDGRIELLQIGPEPVSEQWFDQVHPVTDLAFSADGTRLFGASKAQSLFVWDLVNRRLERRLSGHEAYVEHVALTPDSSPHQARLVSSGADATARLWDVGSPPRETYDALPFRVVRAVHATQGPAPSPDGSRELFALVLFAGELQVRRVDDESLVRAWRVQSDRVHACAIDEDRGIVACDEGQAIRVFGLHDEETFLLEGHAGSVLALDLSASTGHLASASIDGTVRVWDLETRREIVSFSHGGADSDMPPWTVAKSLWKVRFSPDERQLASVSGAGRLAVSTLDRGTHKAGSSTRYYQAPEALFALDWSPDGSTVAAGGRDGQVHEWNLATGAHRRSSSAHSQSLIGLCYTPDGQRILSVSDDESLRIWDSFDLAEVVALRPTDSPARSMALGPKGETLLIGHRLGLTTLRTSLRSETGPEEQAAAPESK